MEKRYQVFVSSTYADLKDERQKVIQALMQLDCIPSGMELFPAMDEEQFAFIKRVIDDCDYYLLIIGGRYGSLSENGVSYTEQEYDYAISKGMKVLALIHGSPDTIALGKSERDPSSMAKLEAFRKKVSTGRLVKFWKDAHELPAIVALSLPQTIKTYPAIGWIRADRAANEDVLSELNTARRQIEELKSQVNENSKEFSPVVGDIAGLQEDFVLKGTYWHGQRTHVWQVQMSWRDIFITIGPYLMQTPAADAAKTYLTREAFRRFNFPGSRIYMDDQVFQTVALQLKALGLVKIDVRSHENGSSIAFWSSTPAGEKLTLEGRLIRSTSAE
ncbi:MAG: DUF4062 domain-containing protein [Rubrivivax sp.]|nr:MAG: DUF4062 domain-containing protein [Rubrivivax sp.]